MAYTFNDDKSKSIIDDPIVESGTYTADTKSYKYIVYEDGTLEYDLHIAATFPESSMHALGSDNTGCAGGEQLAPVSYFRNKTITEEIIDFCVYWRDTNRADVPTNVYGFSPRWARIKNDIVPRVDYAFCIDGYPTEIQVALDFHIVGKLA